MSALGILWQRRKRCWYQQLHVIHLKKVYARTTKKTFAAGPEYKKNTYHQISNARRTLADNKIVHHSDVAGASPVSADPTTSSFSTSNKLRKDNCKTRRETFKFWNLVRLILDISRYLFIIWTLWKTSYRGSTYGPVAQLRHHFIMSPMRQIHNQHHARKWHT